MTTKDAIARLEAYSEDLILIRVSGSVRIEPLPGGLNWKQAEDIIDQALEKAENETT